MTTAGNWLRSRIEGAPDALMDRMIATLEREEGDDVPRALAAGALRLYGEVARGSGGREDALPLLAADALFTHAFQAQAELDPGRLDELVTHCQAGLREVVP